MRESSHLSMRLSCLLFPLSREMQHIRESVHFSSFFDLLSLLIHETTDNHSLTQPHWCALSYAPTTVIAKKLTAYISSSSSVFFSYILLSFIDYDYNYAVKVKGWWSHVISCNNAIAWEDSTGWCYLPVSPFVLYDKDLSPGDWSSLSLFF